MTINQITGSHGGVVLNSGNYGNPLTITQTGTVAGPISGTSLWTVINKGLIETGGKYIYLGGGGSFDNSGTILASGVADMSLEGTATLTNSGLIEDTGTAGDGVYIAGGLISNATHGTIIAATAVYESYGTVDNAGLINAGTIGVRVLFAGDVDNSGTIVAGLTGVYISGAGKVDNSGRVGGKISINGGGSVTNAATGIISAADDAITGAALTVYNAGTITGGIYLPGGTITNDAGATIGGTIHSTVGFTLDNAGTVSGVNVTSGQIDNSGSIGGVNVTSGQVNNSGSIGGVIASFGQVDNSGSIGGSGVHLDNTYFTNEATGTVSGSADGVYIHGANRTFENAGKISGAKYAVFFNGYGYNNRLIIDPGATFVGKVQFVPGYNPSVVAYGAPAFSGVLQLNSGALNGTLNGLGTKYIAFGGAEIEKGASWKITGTKDGFSGQAIAGFNNSDSLDITDLAFDAADTATVNGSYQLVIDNSDSTALAVIQMDSAVASDTFVLANDGHGGTFIDAPAVVEPNTTVSGLVAANGTSITVSSGGTAVGDGIGKGGTEIILVGGIARGTTLSSGAEIVSGTAVSAVVRGGGIQTVVSGGVASATTVLAGGEIVFAGGTVSGLKISSGGGAEAASGAKVSSFIVGAGITFTVRSGAVVGSATLQSGGKLIFSGGTVDALTLADGVTQSGITVTCGANLIVSSGATASGTTVLSGGKMSVSAGGKSIGASVLGSQTVTNSGTTSRTGIGAGGAAVISSGGKTISTTVSSGGTETVLTGGTDSNVAVKSGGTLVFGGGMVTGATVSSGGREAIAKGVTASGLSAGSGVTLTVSSGGTAFKATVVAGGTLADLGHTVSATVSGKVSGGKVTSGVESVAAKAIASATSVGPGGVLIVSSGGTAIRTVLSGSGTESVLSGGIVSGAVTLKGAGDTLSIGGTKLAALTISGFANGDTIDLASFAFKGAKLYFAENAAKTSDTLTIIDGSLKAKVTLFGEYVATGFKLSAAGNGTTITYTSGAAAHEGLAPGHS